MVTKRSGRRTIAIAAGGAVAGWVIVALLASLVCAVMAL